MILNCNYSNHITVIQMLQIIFKQRDKIYQLEKLTASVPDDTDSGVVCTDTTDIDNDNSDAANRHEEGEDCHEQPESNKYNLVTSRRVYLNHRNITKMKDIKYKRITKSKSKSMEELRDKLREGLHFKWAFYKDTNQRILIIFFNQKFYSR